TDRLCGLAGEGCTRLHAVHTLERGLALGQRRLVLSQGRIVYDERRESIDPTAFPETYRALTTSYV
ncbi:MAG: hypothetical protein DRI77_12645, partial [Chloroflexi bacterium]